LIEPPSTAMVCPVIALRRSSRAVRRSGDAAIFVVAF
jgi:hypothetical protein